MSEETVHSFCSLSLLQSFPFLTTLPRAELCTLFFPFSLQLLPNLPALNDLLCNCMSDFPLDWSSLWAGPLSIIQCIPIGCQEKAPFCDICLCVLQSCCKIGFYKPQEFFSVHFFLWINLRYFTDIFWFGGHEEGNHLIMCYPETSWVKSLVFLV